MYSDVQASSRTSLLTHRGGHRQRAFRDRKRQRVQELEAQLSALEVRTNSLESDNERLQHELLLTREENEALRGITQPQPPRNTLQPARRRTVTKADNMHLPAQ
jgi:TolA-binding protein